MKYFIFTLLFVVPFFFGANDKFNTRSVNADSGDDLCSRCKRDYQVSMFNLLMDSVYRSGRYHGVLLVADNGKVVYKKPFGSSKYAPHEPFETNSAMQLASVSKPFTAVAVLMLIERNVISLDDDIRKYLPQLKYQGITVRHLLNHTSGLPDYLNRERVFARYIDERQELTNEKLLNVLAKYKPRLEFKPGTRHKYSNTGYALLPLIIEKATGESFVQYMQQYVFDKVGMHNSFLYSKERNIKMKREKEYRDGVLGDKGLFSTVDDMFLWDQALYTEKLVKQATLDAAFSRGSTLADSKFNYGLGWRISTSGYGERIIYHKGFWQGATPMLIRFVDCRRTIISLHHASRFDSWFLVNTVNHILNQSEVQCANY